MCVCIEYEDKLNVSAIVMCEASWFENVAWEDSCSGGTRSRCWDLLSPESLYLTTLPSLVVQSQGSRQCGGPFMALASNWNPVDT